MKVLITEEIRVLASSGNLNTTTMKVNQVYELVQKLPVGIHIHDSQIDAVLDPAIVKLLEMATGELSLPVLAGDLPGHLAGPYEVHIWEYSESDEEQEKLWETFDILDGVIIPKVSFTRPEKPPETFGLSMTLWIPWYGEGIAGRLASFTQSKFWLSMKASQLSMNLEIQPGDDQEEEESRG